MTLERQNGVIHLINHVFGDNDSQNYQTYSGSLQKLIEEKYGGNWNVIVGKKEDVRIRIHFGKALINLQQHLLIFTLLATDFFSATYNEYKVIIWK